MSTNKSHADALKAYLNLLEKNATNPADYSLKEHFVEQLITNLHNKSVTAETYRQAVDELLSSMPPEYKKDAVLVAREFFPFLMSDVKAVAAMMQTGGYRGFAEAGGAVTQQRIRTMADLVTVAGNHTYSNQHTASLDQYLGSLRSHELDGDAVAMRGRIARTLLYMSRDKAITPEQYRSAIDRIMPALTTEAARLFFVVVAREFYHFLTLNPAAALGINAEACYQSRDVFG
ncbi:MAG: hypothetical protein ABI790_06575 [Betaproteobacteria bacterium]